MKKLAALSLAAALVSAPILAQAPAAEAAPVKSVALSGKVFLDKNGNRIFNKGETVAINRLVKVYNTKNKVVATVKTNKAGNYAVNLIPGTYTLKVAAGRGEVPFSVKTKLAKGKRVVNAPIKLVKKSSPKPAAPTINTGVTAADNDINVFMNRVNKARAAKGLKALVPANSCVENVTRPYGLMFSDRGLTAKEMDSLSDASLECLNGEHYIFGISGRGSGYVTLAATDLNGNLGSLLLDPDAQTFTWGFNKDHSFVYFAVTR